MTDEGFSLESEIDLALKEDWAFSVRVLIDEEAGRRGWETIAGTREGILFSLFLYHYKMGLIF